MKKAAIPLLLAMTLACGAGYATAQRGPAGGPGMHDAQYGHPGPQGHHGFGPHGPHGPRGPHGPHGPQGPHGFGPCGCGGDEIGGPCDGFECPDEFDGPRHGMRPPLSPEGRQKAKAIAEEFRPKFEKINDALFVKRHELKALESASTPDVKAVGECASEIVTLRHERSGLRREMRERMRKEVFEPEAKKAPKGGK